MVVDSGSVRIETMSLGACLGKLFNFTSRSGIVVGKNMTVSQSLVVFVLGNKN